MNFNVLHDVLFNEIVPFLFRTNTNPTTLIFMTLNKRANKKKGE
ncbi:unnamed protein product, partial [marine sediment metagenome]